jgi:ATP-dependent Clp protease ATP-binding subunit ClpA
LPNYSEEICTFNKEAPNLMSMWEPFTARARQCIVLAQEEAQRLGCGYIGTEHILLGILKHGDNDGALSLNAYGVTYETASAEVALILGKRDPVRNQEMVFEPQAKRVIELAFEEARILSHNYIGAVHLTLGLLREDQGVAARVIATLGRGDHATPFVAIRNDLLAREPSEKPEKPEPKPDPSSTRCPHCGKRITVVRAE